ncbi:hypothetical protein WSK_1759 [Novosphingobium sp. Rr 2-17]|uniref:hypothetical protein n=1 Tax=Novosphingobium sp. Rr 2-17 TaxID=555793 RepID=UPI000269A7EE|nr:hypothetical protein [Novosphingobium sp. Rr 2-17]EIZ79679.1 hypothetical protein WSK_1759 [Novosphingobium sp. Rr 2-17]
MPKLIKITQDGRRLEVTGTAIVLDGKLESLEVTDLVNHPRKFEILRAAPDATHVAGRVALTAAEAELAKEALWQGQEQLAANPAAIAERFRLAANRRAWGEGIE